MELSLRGDGPETEEFCFHVASACVWRCVDQAVGGHDAVLAHASDPVVSGVVVAGEVGEFDSSVAGEEEFFGGFFAVAAMVMACGP